LSEGPIVVEEFPGQFDDISAWNSCAKKDSEHLGISQRIDAAPEKLFTGFLLIW
jgi:hypothetical protein